MENGHGQVNVHLIGICGTAMATLAALLKRRGHHVRGSDEGVYPPMDAFLEREAIPVLVGYKAEHITSDLSLVVVGNAISRGNPELEEVLGRKIRHCSLPEAIREQFLWGARSIVIAGTHGKTTTAALAGWLLAHAQLDPTVLVGGIALNFGEEGSSYRLGHGREFVIEGDEYDSAFFDKTAKFLKYLPDIALVNNIEFDHADIYADLDAVRLAFRRLANLVPRNGLLLLGSDSPDAAALRAAAVSPVETFGLAEGADWRGYDLEVADGITRFKLQRGGSYVGTFESPLLGQHNVRNAVGALAIGSTLGVLPGTLAEGLRAVPRGQAAARSGRSRERRHRLRRFRAPSHSGRRDDCRGARRPSRAARVGRLRAAVRIVLPPRVPGRLRAGVCERRRDGARPRLPIHPARGPAAVGRSTGHRSRRGGTPGAAHRHDRRHRRDDRPRAPRRGRGAHHVERRLRRHSSQAGRGPAARPALTSDRTACVPCLLLPCESRPSVMPRCSWSSGTRSTCW